MRMGAQFAGAHVTEYAKAKGGPFHAVSENTDMFHGKTFLRWTESEILQKRTVLCNATSAQYPPY